MLTRLGLIVVCAAALALAACGDDEGADGEPGDAPPAAADGFAAQADELCRDTAVDVRQTREELGPAISLERAVELAEAIRDIARQRLDDLERIEPDPGAADAYERMLEIERDRLELADEAVAALRDEDPEAFAAAAQRDEQLFARSRSAAEEAGMVVCAGVLPEETVAAVEDAIERSQTSGDPAIVCDELATEFFLEAQFGGQARCEALIAEAVEPPDAIEIDDVNGVDGVEARAQIVARGGRQDGLEARIALVHEDGAWKVDRLILETDGASDPEDQPQA